MALIGAADYSLYKHNSVRLSRDIFLKDRKREAVVLPVLADGVC